MYFPRKRLWSIDWLRLKILGELDDSDNANLVNPRFLNDSDNDDFANFRFFDNSGRSIRIGCPNVIHSDLMYTVEQLEEVQAVYSNKLDFSTELVPRK